MTSRTAHNFEAVAGRRQRAYALLNDFASMVLENLKSAGVHQAAKDDRISFTALAGWPGGYIAAEGHFMEGDAEKRAAIFIGPEFGTVARADLTAAAREALDARFDALIACGFNFDAHTSGFIKLGPLPILKAKMNPGLHMSEELKNTGAGNLFVVFGEPVGAPVFVEADNSPAERIRAYVKAQPPVRFCHDTSPSSVSSAIPPDTPQS